MTKHILRTALMISVMTYRLFGQAVSGTVVGTVTDPVGAVVPDATVTITSEATGLTRTTTTNANGQYRADAFPTGRLTVSGERQGFQKLVRAGITLTAADTITVNLELSVGDVRQSVQVTEAAPLLQAQTATVSTLITNQQLAEMPINGRSFTQLLQLSSGVAPSQPGTIVTGLTGYSSRASNNVSVNGNTAQNNAYLVDGLYDVGLWTQAVVLVPTIDSIQEQRLMANAYSAQYGGAAGAVTLVQSKSGSSSFHGGAYEYLRNGKLDANFFFNNRNRIAKPIQQRNEFGGTFGGPLWKDKTFFFIDYQGIRWNLPTNTTQSIPTLAQRQMVATGNFSSLGTTIFDPTSAPAGANRLPFAGNIIPPERLNSAALRLFSLLPAPTSSAATNNFVWNPVTVQHVNQADARIDQNFGVGDRFFVKWSYDPFDAIGNCLLPANPAVASSVGVNPNCMNSNFYSTESRDYSVTANYTRIVRANFIDEIRVGALRNFLNNYNPDFGIPVGGNLGNPSLNVQDLNYGMPAQQISGFATNPVFGTSGSSPEFLHTVTFQFENVATLNKGNHSIKFGGVYFADRFNGHTSVFPRGFYDYNGQYTRQVGTSTGGAPLADFALGYPDSIQRSEQFGVFGQRRWRSGVFMEDAWRVNNRLTFTYGMRYELQAPYHEVFNRFTNLTPGGQIVYPNNNPCGASTICLDKKDWAPRAGIAYMLTKDQKTVLRVGGGMSYFGGTNGGRGMISNAPINVIQQFTTNPSAPPTLSLTQPLPLPTPPNLADPTQLTQIFFAQDTHLKLAQSMQWSFDVQRELRSDLMLDVAYVGTRTNRMMNFVNANMAVPGLGAPGPRRPLFTVNPAIPDIQYKTNYAAAKYHSLQVNLDKRYGKGLSGHMAYTWSHNMSNSVGPNAQSYPPMNSLCTACDWGPVNEDRRQMLVINHVYELPFGPHRQFSNSGFLSYIVGNWDISGLWSLYSGLHYNPVNGTANISGSQYPASPTWERPNLIGTPNLPTDQRTIDHWFNTAAFVQPVAGTFGNAGAYILEGPGTQVVDFGIHRNFPIREKITTSLRLEIFNSFNHPNFTFNPTGAGVVPIVAAGSASAGVITGTYDPRRMQAALKISF